MINKKIVYIPTKIEDEIPEIEGYYKTEEEETSYLSSTGNWFDNNRLQKPRYPIHWLKPTEVYAFTPEELKEIIKKAVDDTIDTYHYYVENPHNPPPMNGNDYFENFLNKEK